MRLEIMGERIAFRIDWSLPKFRKLIPKRKLRELRLKQERVLFKQGEPKDHGIVIDDMPVVRDFGEPCLDHGAENCQVCLANVADEAVKAIMAAKPLQAKPAPKRGNHWD